MAFSRGEWMLSASSLTCEVNGIGVWGVWLGFEVSDVRIWKLGFGVRVRGTALNLGRKVGI